MDNHSALSNAIKKNRDSRTLIEDENGDLIMKKDLTRWERVRIFLNRWWVFTLLVLAVCQVFQTIISLLNYLNNP